MIDKNAPWRLVFNLAAGWNANPEPGASASGGQMFMDRFGINYGNVFDFYYRKAHLEEVLNLKNIYESLYTSFYQQYATYQTLAYTKCIKEQESSNLKVISTRKPRSGPEDFGSEEHYEYWLKLLLKLRFAETSFPHTTYNFNFFVNEMLDNKRLFGLDAALNYVNDLTKGFFVPNFVKRRTFWGGMTETEYHQKRKQALEEAINPLNVRYSLTGTKNIK